MFHHQYQISRGDSLTSIANKLGYDNPGPIFYYPGNQKFFGKRWRDANEIFPGEMIYVPHKRENLQDRVVLFNKLLDQARKQNIDLLNWQRGNKKDLDWTFNSVDIATFLGTIFVQIGGLAAKSTVKLSQSKIAIDFVQDRLFMSHGLSPLINKLNSTKKQDLSFWVRHLTGALSPSYVATMVTGIFSQQVDYDVHLYGIDSYQKNKLSYISKQADASIHYFKKTVNEIESQIAMPFYDQRI